MKRRALLATALCALAVSTSLQAAPPSEPVESIVCRGQSAEGFSYWWGGECWCDNGCVPNLSSCQPGQCTPNSGSTGCPDCTHSGTYGADCSGFVSKAWQVPEPFAPNACDVDRYVASDFTADHQYWDVVSMDSLQPADAVASSSHVILVIGAKDSAGEHEVVEAKGCSYGIVRHSRTFASTYSGARRINLSACVCADGDEETKNCGDCGTQKRACEGGCLWSAWSACDGPDPSGAESSCNVEGQKGACASGQRLCVAGWLTCQSVAPSTEVCDGEDNDCDGVVDNGTPASLGEGLPCKNSCGDGTSKCVNGAVQCLSSGACAGPADAGSAGSAGKSGSSGTWSSGGDDDSGCGCRAGARGSTSLLAGAIALLGLIALRRKRG